MGTHPPRRLRNWFFSIRFDGRDKPIQGGPLEPDGGFSFDIMSRQEGRMIHVARLVGTSLPDGRTLQLALIDIRREGFPVIWKAEYPR